MDGKRQKFQLRRQRHNRQRILAFCLIFSLVLSNLNFGSMLTYATEGKRRTFEIGSDVKAVLKDGVLTVKGYGDTRDFSCDTAPFAEYADEIRTLVIEDGITYIGSCLFYGLGGLQGELILPESIVGIGDYAFSGESPAQAARFTVIRNEFEGGEITEWKKAEPEESETVTLATPSQAEKVTSEERIEEGEQNGEADKTGDENAVNEGNREETKQETAEQTEQGETEPGKPDRIEQGETEQEETEQEEAERTEPKETQEEMERTEPEETAHGDTLSLIARIENHQVPFVGEGMPEGDSDSSGSESGMDAGSADSGDDSGDAGSGGADTGDSGDADSGSGDTGGGGDADSGSGDTGGGGDTNNGSGDTGSGDANSGSTDTGSGNTDVDSGSTDTGGDNADADGGGSPDTGSGQEGGLSKDDSMDSGDNTEAGDTSGTSGDKPGDAAGQGSHNQELPSESENGTGGKDSRPQKVTENLEAENPDYDIEYISQQKIENPETVFYEGQTGMVICSPENGTFIEAAEYAGYVMADSCITVILDDMMEMELPACEGQVCLPECPEEIKCPWDDNAIFTAKFAGWTLEPGTEPAKALVPGTYTDTGEEHLNLYSVWKPVGTYQMGVRAERQGGTAIYTLFDKETGETVNSMDGYAFLYQWQYSAQGADIPDDKNAYGEDVNRTDNHGNGDDGLWEDIAGEDSPVYKRSVKAGDMGMRFRCAVTPVKMTRSMTAASSVTLYSEPANGVAVLETVYVNQTSGDDGNSGLENAPVKTVEAAVKKKNQGGWRNVRR